jgi:hypothetical protein
MKKYYDVNLVGFFFIQIRLDPDSISVEIEIVRKKKK